MRLLFNHLPQPLADLSGVTIGGRVEDKNLGHFFRSKFIAAIKLKGATNTRLLLQKRFSPLHIGAEIRSRTLALTLMHDTRQALAAPF